MVNLTSFVIERSRWKSHLSTCVQVVVNIVYYAVLVTKVIAECTEGGRRRQRHAAVMPHWCPLSVCPPGGAVTFEVIGSPSTPNARTWQKSLQLLTSFLLIWSQQQNTKHSTGVLQRPLLKQTKSRVFHGKTRFYCRSRQTACEILGRKKMLARLR